MPELVNPDTEIADAVRETEFEILEEAFGKEPEAEPEQPDDQGDKAPTRDEQGRFAAKEPDQEAEVTEPADKEATPPEGEKPPDGKDDGDSVPRWRLREIAEERRQAQAEAQQLRAELARLQVQRQQPQAEQPQQQEVDPLVDPQGFVKQMRAEFQAELRREALNNNLAIAHMRHGDKFEKAYEALLKEGQGGNHQLVQQLTSQGNPGEAIVRWYQQGELIRETGGDLGKFRETMKAELLKDPEFRKAFIEHIRAEANGQGQSSGSQQQAARNVTRLPPSLSRMSGGSPGTDPIDDDNSDASVFDFAFRK